VLMITPFPGERSSLSCRRRWFGRDLNQILAPAIAPVNSGLPELDRLMATS
jgi:hypothetical protein